MHRAPTRGVTRWGTLARGQPGPPRRVQQAGEVAAGIPQTDSVVDLDSVTCPGGKFTTDIDGQAVRRSDGVHFTDAAGPVLGPKIMPAIVAAGRAQMAGAS